MSYIFRRLCLWLFFCLALSSNAADLILLHTNDHHGQYWCQRTKADAPCEGGLAAQYTLVQEIRREARTNGEHVLLLSAGDVNTGAPESNLFQAEADFRGMNLLGYDAMAIGNHEFDIPFPVLKKQEIWAGFPFLAANIYDRKTGRRLFRPYVKKNLGGLRVLLVGLTTEDSVFEANPEITRNFDFRNPATELRKILEEEKKRYDILIVLSHLGNHGEAVHNFQSMGDQALARLVPEIDVIIGGHSHEEMRKPLKVGKTLIVQAHERGRFLGKLRLEVNKQKTVTNSQYELLPVNVGEQALLAPIPEDPRMLDLLRPFYERAQQLLDNKILGFTPENLDGERDHVRNHPTNLSQLITKSIQNYTQADVAIMNGGGIRASIPAGSISARQVMAVNPFNDAFVVIRLNGEEVQSYLEASWQKQVGSGAYLHFAGVTETEGELRINSTKIELNAYYKIALPYFLAVGGNGYQDLIARFNDAPGRIRYTGVRFLEIMEASLPKALKERYGEDRRTGTEF